VYWIGDVDCGWAGCNFNLTSNVSRDRTDPISPQYLSVGITNPFDILDGDTVTLCGMAYVEDPDAITLNWYIGYFTCSEAIGAGDFTQRLITNGTDTGDGYGKICFGGSYTFDANALLACDDHWTVGLNVQSVGIDTKVRFTYTLNVERPCT
jgi:hypothetical protein